MNGIGLDFSLSLYLIHILHLTGMSQELYTIGIIAAMKKANYSDSTVNPQTDRGRQPISRRKEVPMATSKKVTPIKASLAFTQDGPADLYPFGCSVYAGMNNNPAYPQPPVDMATLKSTLDGYNTLIAAALDGSKKVLVQRDHQGEVLKKILKELAHYAQSASKDDMTIFTSSSFQAVSKVRTATPPLSQSIRKITQGSSSGVLLVWLAAIAGALSYEIRWVAVPAGTTIPAAPAWTSILVPSVRPPATVSDLTPGTNYHFEVRVLTNSGWSDWGGWATRMVI